MEGLSLTVSAVPQQRGVRSLMLRTNARPGAPGKGRPKGGLAKGRPDVAAFKAGFGGGGLVKQRTVPACGVAGQEGCAPALVQPRLPRQSQQPLQPQQQQHGLGSLVGGTPLAIPSGPPTRCTRAKVWTPEVENCFRLQNAGWREVSEYVVQYPEGPTQWPNGFYRCVRVKDTGFFTYWSDKRECEDKYVPRIKVFSYE